MMSPHHPYFQRVQRVASRLIKANADTMQQLGPKNWKCYVIDEPKTINAFVLPVSYR